jgi:hypothetical protein
MSSAPPAASAPAPAPGPRLLGVPVPARAFGFAPGWCREDETVVVRAIEQDPRQMDVAYRTLRLVGGMSHQAKSHQVAAA